MQKRICLYAMAFLVAAAISIVAFVAAALYLELQVFGDPKNAVNLPVWNPAPSLFRPSFAVAAVAIVCNWPMACTLRIRCSNGLRLPKKYEVSYSPRTLENPPTPGQPPARVTRRDNLNLMDRTEGSASSGRSGMPLRIPPRAGQPE